MSLISNSLIRRWFGPQTLTSLTSSTPPTVHPTLLSVLDDPSMAALEGREAVLGLAKQEMLGYVFLVDGQGKVRWRAWGEMVGDDAVVMRRVVEELKREVRDRMDRREEGKTKVKGKEAQQERAAYDWRAKANANAVERTNRVEAATVWEPPVEQRREGRGEEENKRFAGARAVLATTTRLAGSSKT